MASEPKEPSASGLGQRDSRPASRRAEFARSGFGATSRRTALLAAIVLWVPALALARPSSANANLIRLGSSLEPVSILVGAARSPELPTAETLALPAGIFTSPVVVQGLSAESGTSTRDSDDNLDVGATQAMQWANFQLQIYTKQGNPIGSPILGTQFFANAGNSCAAAVSADGLVKYDRLAKKWLVALRTGMNSECIAVSQSSDAAGKYDFYLFTHADPINPNTTQMDYPKIGIWPDGYYIAFDMLDTNNNYNWEYNVICSLDRTSMLAGSSNPRAPVCELPGTQTNSATQYHLMPSDLTGTTPPPLGSPNYVITFATLRGQSAYHLYLYQFHVDFTTPTNSTLTGPLQIDVDAFATAPPACGAGTHNCIPQPRPATSQNNLDSVGGYLMYRFAYRNFGNHESLVITQAANRNTGNQVGVRWYEIRNPKTKPSIYQAGLFTPDATQCRWMSSAAMDKVGNLAIGYSISSTSTFPSIGVTGRRAGDPKGKLDAEQVVYSGSFAEIGPAGKGRWGAYSSMALDPGDDCTFFYTNQYEPSQGYYNWSTKIVIFRITGCTSSK